MGVTVSDENIDDQSPNEFRELLEPVGKNIKYQSADRIVVGRLIFLVSIYVKYLREVFGMDAAFGSPVITFDCVGPRFPLRDREAAKPGQIEIIEFHYFAVGRLYSGRSRQPHHRVFICRYVRMVRVRWFYDPFLVPI